MDWLKNLISANPILSLLLPTGISSFTFFSNLLTAMSDGKIDSNEMHQLMSGASGVETIVLLLVMFVLNSKNSK